MPCFFVLLLFTHLFLNNAVIIKNNHARKQSVHLQKIEKGTNFTITSISIVDNQKKSIKSSKWLDHIFGNFSVNYLHEESIFDDEGNYNDISGLQSVINVFTYFQDKHPLCQLEMLGFTKLGIAAPFLSSYRNIKPAAGNAHIMMPREYNSDRIPCIYRAMYENWRNTEHIFGNSPHFWSTVYYCPIFDAALCRNLVHRPSHKKAKNNAVIKMAVSMKLSRVTWTTNLTSLLNSNPKSIKKSKLAKPQNNTDNNTSSSSIGICLVIPYTSSDINKVKINGAILTDWIRYYLKLGIKIFIYDGGGDNYNYVYSKRLEVSSFSQYFLEKNLFYYNYTIKRLLNKSLNSSNLKYDNSEKLLNFTSERLKMAHQQRFLAQGDDKVLTLTHCRFEARTSYGIEKIIVADSDEFLYCPFLPAVARIQSSFINTIVTKLQSKGYEQISFNQRNMLNKTQDVYNCVKSNTLGSGKKTSALNCFTSLNYTSGKSSVKSIHLDYSCPLTNYHEACGGGGYNRASSTYNCVCESAIYGKHCAFYHLTTVDKFFSGFDYGNATKNIDLDIASNSENEILKIINS